MKQRIDLMVSSAGASGTYSLPAVGFSLDVTLPFLLHCRCLIDEIHCRARFNNSREVYQAVEAAKRDVALTRLAAG